MPTGAFSRSVPKRASRSVSSEKRVPVARESAPGSAPFSRSRIKSGIPGFDDLVFGGVPQGNLVMLSGEPGAGKTAFCLGFLYQGVTKFDEPGVFVSLEESVEGLLSTAQGFGFDFAPLVERGLVKFVTVELYDFDKLKNAIEDAVSRIGAKRVVVDPGAVFRLFFEKELDARRNILSLSKMLRRLSCTTLITNELNLEEEQSLFGLEEYVADGVVLLYHTRLKGRFIRSIAVLKMRGTAISDKLKPVSIGDGGIRVLSSQEMFENVE